MLTEVQQIILTCLLGPEDKTAFQRAQRRHWNRESAARRYAQNPEKKLAYERSLRVKNRERIRTRDRAGYVRRFANSDSRAARNEASRKHREKNVERVREQSRRSAAKIRSQDREAAKALGRAQAHIRRSTPGGKILDNLRRRVRSALKGAGKLSRTKELIGCTIPELRAHLEKQFRPGMTWENYGSVWHIDHIRPCASFDFTDLAQQQECFHYTNQQPLFVKENLQKGDKWLASYPQT